MDLKTKLAFALVSAALLSMGALGYFTYLWVEGMIFEESRRRLAARAESREAELQGVFEGWQRDLRALVTATQLPELAVRHLDTPDAGSSAHITRLLQEAQAFNGSIRRLTLFDAEGNRLSGAQDQGSSPASPSSDLLGDPAADVVFSGVRIEEDARVGIVFQAPVVQGGRRVGLVEAEFDASALDALVGPTVDVGRTGETVVVVPIAQASAAESAYVALPPRERGPRFEAPPAIAAALAGREEVMAAVVGSRGQEVTAATRSLPASGFGVVVQVDTEEVQARADRLLKDMRDLGAGVAAFAILGGTLLGLRLARPINRLVEGVDRIRHGEIGLRLDVKGEDEAAFLAMSLNEFLDQLDRSSDLFQLGELEVLVVDGDDQSRRILQELLRNWNMRPTLKDGEASALREIERVERDGRPFQLIVLDESTTDLDGDRLADVVRSSDWNSCPIITLSSSTDPRDGATSRKTEFGRELSKPVIASHLMEAILEEMGVSARALASTNDVYLKKIEPRKILVAEDSPLIQQVMLGFLENWGHAVTLAENGRLAVECARAERFDLVLMDLEMPEMGGLEATAAIRAAEREGERIPIIALTAEARSADRERCLAAGMDDYIAKPADPKVLYALISRCPPRALGAESHDDDADVVDWGLARSLTGDDEELLREVIAMFPQESRSQLDAIRRAIQTADAAGLERAAHTLKSSAGLLGASALVQTSLEMEQLGREAQFADAGSRLEALESETGRVCAALARAAESAEG